MSNKTVNFSSNKLYTMIKVKYGKFIRITQMYVIWDNNSRQISILRHSFTWLFWTSKHIAMPRFNLNKFISNPSLRMSLIWAHSANTNMTRQTGMTAWQPSCTGSPTSTPPKNKLYVHINVCTYVFYTCASIN